MSHESIFLSLEEGSSGLPKSYGAPQTDPGLLAIDIDQLGISNSKENNTTNSPPVVRRDAIATSTNVVRGFKPGNTSFGQENEHCEPFQLRAYPPTSNKSYKLTSDGHFQKFATNQQEPIKINPYHREDLDWTPPMDINPQMVRVLEVAEDVERRRLFTSQTGHPAREKLFNPRTEPRGIQPSSESLPFDQSQGQISSAEELTDRSGIKRQSNWGSCLYPRRERRADPDVIDNEANKPKVPKFVIPQLLLPRANKSLAELSEGELYQYCRKCDTNHILPGAPNTLYERDTCGAYLPDWFPTDMEDPWEAFRVMINQVATYDEMERGIVATKPVWDKEYHEEHPKWRKIGRRHGWWKCRSEESAPWAERTCEVCHKPKTCEQEDAAVNHAIPLSLRRKQITDWIDEQMAQVAAKDKAIGEEMIRQMDHSRPLGYLPHYKIPNNYVPHIMVSPSELEGYDTADDSHPDGDSEVGLQQQLSSGRPRTPKLRPEVLREISQATLDLGAASRPDIDASHGSVSTTSSEGLFMRSGKKTLAR